VGVRRFSATAPCPDRLFAGDLEFFSSLSFLPRASKVSSTQLISRGRLQRPVEDRGDRGEDGGDAALQAVRPLAVGERQQGEAADDQKCEYRPTAAYLLAIPQWGPRFLVLLKARMNAVVSDTPARSGAAAVDRLELLQRDAEPTATQVSGDSASWQGIWHSSWRRCSSPLQQRASARQRVMPGPDSPASSGGVWSSVSLTAATMWPTGSSKGLADLSEVSSIVFGSPLTRSRPRSRPGLGRRGPPSRLELDLLAVLRADREFVFALQWATIASSSSSPPSGSMGRRRCRRG